MRILSEPKNDGTKRHVQFILYAPKNADGSVPSVTITEEMSDSEWRAFKRLPDNKKLELVKRESGSAHREEVIVGGAPVMDDSGKTTEDYVADLNVNEQGIISYNEPTISV